MRLLPTLLLPHQARGAYTIRGGCDDVHHARGTGAPSQAPPPSNLQALPHDLSPWGMFLAADIVVKAVMIGLFLASVLTWTVWIAKSIELGGARRSLRNASQALSQSNEPGRCRAENWREEFYVRSLIEQADLELRLSAIY